jgi:hypothetical protein
VVTRKFFTGDDESQITIPNPEFRTPPRRLLMTQHLRSPRSRSRKSENMKQLRFILPVLNAVLASFPGLPIVLNAILALPFPCAKTPPSRFCLCKHTSKIPGIQASRDSHYLPLPTTPRSVLVHNPRNPSESGKYPGF